MVKTHFVNTLLSYLKSKDVQCERISFADALKADVDPFLKDKVGISAFTERFSRKIFNKRLFSGLWHEVNEKNR